MTDRASRRDGGESQSGLHSEAMIETVKPNYPDRLRLEIDAYLEQLRFSDIPEVEGLEQAMRYSLLAGGKRIRPVLALATARALGHEPASVMPFAAALELIHTYSLIHDDLPAMDDDDLRRGKPTCHMAFGENVAILAGDALFAEALKLIATRQLGSPQLLIAAITKLLDATGAGGMVGGQFIDVAGAVEDSDSLRFLHELKTGRLIGASVTGVALLLDAPGSVLGQLSEFAAELGVLFQIIDDILDVTGAEVDLGKPRGSDERHGKSTFVSMFGLERARELATESHQKALASITSATLPGDDAELKSIADFVFSRNS